MNTTTSNQIKIDDNTTEITYVQVKDQIENNSYDFRYPGYSYTTISYPQACPKHEFRAIQKDEKFVISIDLPGVCLADIQLSLDGNNLSLVATRKDPVETIAKTYFILGSWDLGTSQANLENGVLSIIFSEKKSTKKEIKIQEKK